MLVARIVLQIGVGHKGYDRVEDCRRRQNAELSWIEGRDRLQAENDKAKYEERYVEDHKRDYVLLPILRAGVDEVLEPLEHARRAIFPVHQPGEIAAERDRTHDRRRKKQCRKKPHGRSLSGRLPAPSAPREQCQQMIQIGLCVSEPLGPDERGEEVDNNGSGHRNRDVGHRRGLLRFLRRRR